MPALSLLVFLAVWQGLAVYLNNNTLPAPETVAQVFWQACVTGQLPFHLGVTLLRLVVSFSIAMLLGCAIGIVLGRNKKLDAFFDNWLVIFLNVPALVTIILCYVWFGLIESAAKVDAAAMVEVEAEAGPAAEAEAAAKAWAKAEAKAKAKAEAAALAWAKAEAKAKAKAEAEAAAKAWVKAEAEAWAEADAKARAKAKAKAVASA